MHVVLLQSGSGDVLGRLDVTELQSIPQPGFWMDFEFGSYLVLQRSHRYKLKEGRYQLTGITLEVKQQLKPPDTQLWKGQWVIGEPMCRFNAHSPLLRCAVLPDGPCGSCSHFQKR